MTVHGTLLVAALTLAGGAAVADGLQPVDAARLAREMAGARDRVSAVALAEAIRSGPAPRIFDLRSPADFAAFHIPSASQSSLEALVTMDLPRSTSIVVYSDGGALAAQAWVLLRLRGYRDVAFLRDGVYEWIARVHEPQLAADPTVAERADFDRRAALSRYFGGQPRLDVPRAEIPAGYWTVGGESRPSMSTALLVAAIRRRGC